MKFLVWATALIATAAANNAVVETDDSLAVPGANPLKHCANPSGDILELESVDLDPNPPSAGTKLTVTAKGTLSEDVEDGAKVLLTVKYGLITIIKQTADLCETVKNVDLECPIKKGETKLTKEVNLPSQIPPGKYTVLADVYTKDEKKVTCLTATVEFSRGGSTGSTDKLEFRKSMGSKLSHNLGGKSNFKMGAGFKFDL